MARRGDKMNAKSFDVIDWAVQADDFDFTTVAGAGVHFADVKRAAEGIVNASFELLAEVIRSVLRVVCCQSVIRSRQEPVMRPIGLKGVIGGGDQILAQASGAFAEIGHANGFVGIGAEAAENALAKIERGNALIVFVLVTDCAGGTDGGSGARVAPSGPIDLGFAAGAS